MLDINPDNPDQYRFDGEWLDLEVRDVPIEVKFIGRLRITVKQEALVVGVWPDGAARSRRLRHSLRQHGARRLDRTMVSHEPCRNI